MKNKSKFVVFVLSIIPGLSHIYLGFFYRGYIFMGAAAAGVVAVLGLCALMHSSRPMMLFLGLPVLWFVALIDSMTLADKSNDGMALNSGMGEEDGPGIEAPAADDKLSDQNRKIITCLLSVIPGAGHMFLGYQQRGLKLMALFFFSFFFIDWLRIGLFMFIIPVIWFYSMFDALHKASGNGTPAGGDDLSLPILTGEKQNVWNGSKLLGYGLILIGALLLFDKIISPLISYEIRNYLQTGIVALLFIAGGVRMLCGGRKEGGAKREGAAEKCEDGE